MVSDFLVQLCFDRSHFSIIVVHFKRWEWECYVTTISASTLEIKRQDVIPWKTVFHIHFSFPLCLTFTCTIYIPLSSSKKYIYVDDIALAVIANDFKTIESALSKDLDTLRNFFTSWHLKLHMSKTVCSTFHLANHLANYKLNIKTKGDRIPFDRNPKYLGVTLDRILTFKQHLINTAVKTSNRCNLLKRLTGNSWFHNPSYICIRTLLLCCRVLLSHLE